MPDPITPAPSAPGGQASPSRGRAGADRAAAVRVGLIGYGLAGSVFHAPLITSTEGLHLAAIVTRDPARRSRAEHDYAGVQVLDVPERLWDGEAPVDLVVIASPNDTHAPLAAAAIDAGRHVVVDKPFARTADEGRALIAQADARGVVLVPFHNRRWDGDFRTVRRLVGEGALGDVFRFASRFERWRPTPKPGWKERAAPGAGTGILYDLGTHLVDQALVLFGPATEVYAEQDRRRAGAGGGADLADDDVFVALTHASGVRSHLHASAVAAQLGPRFRVLGSRGAYVKYGLDPQEAALAAGLRPGQPGWGEEAEDRRGTLGAAADVHPVATARGAYEQFYAGVLAAMRGLAPPPVDPREAVAGLEVIEAAQRSAADRRVVRIA